MVSLTWAQVNAWRLSQHLLTNPVKPPDLVRAVGQTLGVHAQVMSAAEMAIAARVDGITPQDVQSALWQDRTLVKTWMMRMTLHLVPAVNFPMYIAARKIADINFPALFEMEGIDGATLDAYLAAAPEILEHGPLTRRQFIEAISIRIKSPEFRDFMVKGNWGLAFKPLALHGELCFGPNDGQESTFVRPSAWIGSWQELDPEASLYEILGNYLQLYGAARPRNFQVWWWMSGVTAKKAFNAIAAETVVVDVEGWSAIALKSAVQAMQELRPFGKVNLLPAFDVFTVGSARGKDLGILLAMEHQKKVYRPQGWVSAVVLVDGFIMGTWEYKLQRSKVSVTVDLFSPINANVQDGIAAEAERLGKFLNTPVELEFTQF